MSFLTEYFDSVDDGEEIAVCCPFPHYTPSGVAYKETNPSAHINTEKNVFHCFVCDKGYSETQFIEKILDCKYTDARKIARCFETEEDIIEWENNTELSEETKKRCLNLGISEKIIKELNIKTPSGGTDEIAIPVFMYNHLMDIRTYNPGRSPKIKSRTNCPSGLIVPFDLWQQASQTRITLLCAGEKDMAVARSHGFNAITLTGGEQTLPKQLAYFKDRQVAICYDNDQAGITGAHKVANELLKYTNKVKVVTGFHEICAEDKEDITDFFTKYNKSKEDLITYIENTPWYEKTQDPIRSYPLVNLLEACSPQNINKIVQSNIQVVGTSSETFTCPNSIIGEKFQIRNGGATDTMTLNQIKDWELQDENCQDILHLIDNNFNPQKIEEHMRDLLKILRKEAYIKIRKLGKVTIFKCYVTDMYETSNTESNQLMEYQAYSINKRLESGQKYLVTYKITPHPYKGSQLIMIILNIQQANDSVNNFVLDADTKTSLQTIQEIPGTPTEKIDHLTECVKGLLGYNGNETLIKTIDLAFHTPLRFNFNNFQNERAYLDTIIVGESRTGKSTTADCLRRTYNLGTFTSLAGNSATIAGLIGGSNKTSSGYQTKAGLIPQNHKGLIIFEEFGKSNQTIITELTDIRSSNEVRLSRIASNLSVPALVRMIALTNPKNVNGQIKSIASYPNGIALMTELVSTAEDIARYDLIVILPNKGVNQIDPSWSPTQPLDTKVYQDRIRWIWSRTADQIIIDPTTELYIIEESNRLNKIYDGHIKIFGTEAWKKISRLAIAVAGYLVSTDKSYENIIITKEHVDYAINFLISIYDNSTFKLKEFVEFERQYTTIDEDGVAKLQDIYTKSPSLIMQLEQSPTTNNKILQGATGLPADILSKQLKELTMGLFIRYSNYDIIPTERFRLGLAKINRATYAPKVGEPDVEISF